MLRFTSRIAGRRHFRSGFLFLVGFVCSFSTMMIFSLNPDVWDENPLCAESFENPQTKDNGFVLIGIMTAAKFVDTRAYHVWKTWAKDFPGKVLFFVAEDTYSIYPEMPLIRLKGVDDSYPPQKKSFAMIHWMYDNYLDDFDWFMRADDDLYVRGEKLEEFLRSLDSKKPHYLGQAGLGNLAEYGQLALGRRENYCMGGPGIVFSKETIRMLGPHLEGCLMELLTTHEDVELGRCVRKHVGIACTWNYEMQTLFHNNQSAPKSFKGTGMNPELKHAITLHPVKEPENMIKTHREDLITQIRELKATSAKLDDELVEDQPQPLVRRAPNTTDDIVPWEYTALNKLTFCADGINCPTHTINHNMKAALGDIINELFDGFNANARQRGRLLQFQNIQYAYSRVDPRHGADYILDIILWFKKFRPPHRATLSVRRHAYVQQTFGPFEAIDEADYNRILKSQSVFYANMTEEERQIALNSEDSKRLFLLMPLKGRAMIFQRFCKNMIEILPPSEKNIELILILYKSDDEKDDVIIREEVGKLSSVMDVRILEMNEEFSRGRALTYGVEAVSPDSLMFFTDVDMLLTFDTIQRIRSNTILGAQVYFPIVFSEFSPQSWSKDDNFTTTSHFSYGPTRGYFRHFGFGLVSIYRHDFERVGGFNTTIRGWGMEDVDLFEKVLTSKLQILRAPEPGLLHVYHSIHCDKDLPEKQRKMCKGSKAQSLASHDFLAEKFLPYA